MLGWIWGRGGTGNYGQDVIYKKTERKKNKMNLHKSRRMSSK